MRALIHASLYSSSRHSRVVLKKVTQCEPLVSLKSWVTYTSLHLSFLICTMRMVTTVPKSWCFEETNGYLWGAQNSYVLLGYQFIQHVLSAQSVLAIIRYYLNQETKWKHNYVVIVLSSFIVCLTQIYLELWQNENEGREGSIWKERYQRTELNISALILNSFWNKGYQEWTAGIKRRGKLMLTVPS